MARKFEPQTGSEPEQEVSPAEVVEAVAPLHVDEITELVFSDDNGNLYRLDYGRMRGDYVLRSA